MKLDGFQTAVCQIDCFVMSRACCGAFGSLEEMFERARPVSALLVVHGEFGRNLPLTIPKYLLAAFGNPLMNLGAQPRRNQPVRNIPIKHVDKSLARSDGSVRQFNQPCRR